MTKKATLAAGCFWGVEETFWHLAGVASTAVGYMGGSFKNPTYIKKNGPTGCHLK